MKMPTVSVSLLIVFVLISLAVGCGAPVGSSDSDRGSWGDQRAAVYIAPGGGPDASVEIDSNTNPLIAPVEGVESPEAAFRTYIGELHIQITNGSEAASSGDTDQTSSGPETDAELEADIAP